MSFPRHIFVVAALFITALAFTPGCGETETSSEECNSSHICVNNSCECQTEGLEGQPCSDDESCEEECRVCTSE